MARRHGFPTTVGRKRQVTWVGPADQDAVSVASGGSTIIASFAPDGNLMIKPTVVRTRGNVSIRPQTFAADLAISGAYGICVVSDEAFTAGAASIPRPFDDASWDGWFVWRSFEDFWEFGDATGMRRQSIVQEVDSKAMRKVSENETVVLMCESQSGALNISMHLRMLFKLS